ncbi:MAG: NADH-quinone oxidoreductase subunit J [Deltaproteobacteria bacterium]|nr:NADH-quinone oxidoreductase subunit J [Deltaproteobacteria bacterium]
MTTSLAGAVVFYALAALAVAGAAWVAFARNIVHSAFALLATFFGVAGLYAFLSADLVAVIQLLVYVGGILILILFAVMLTSRISDVKVSNRSVGLGLGLLVLLGTIGTMAAIALRVPWGKAPPATPEPMASGVGDALLGPYVLPFEVISILLLAALVGAVTLARGKKRVPAPTASGDAASGPGPDLKTDNGEPKTPSPEVQP